MNNGGSGSGFFVLPDQIVTAYHVIEGTSSGYISPVLQPEEKYSIIGITAIDKDNDLVILQISGISGIPLSIGNSEAIKIQDEIYVVGNPLGIPGNVTDGKITHISASPSRFLMDANISSGNSGGAVLDTNSEVIGVFTSSVNREVAPIVQNLNLAIPSTYLTSLLEKAKVRNLIIKPLSVDGVTGKHLIWDDNYYEFSVCNQLAKTIWNIHFLVIFKDKKGETICADRFSGVPLMLYAGEGERVTRFLTSLLTDHSYYDPGVNPEYSYSRSRYLGYVGPGTRRLVKSYEVRILGFEISPLTRGPLLEGITGNGLRWDETDSESMSMSISYNLQNHLDKDLKNIECLVIFYDKENSPIGTSWSERLEVPAGGTLQVKDKVEYSLRQLTERVEYKIYQ